MWAAGPHDSEHGPAGLLLQGAGRAVVSLRRSIFEQKSLAQALGGEWAGILGFTS